jgi:putative flippase GtrA
MNAIVSNFVLPFKTMAQACGILAGLFVNFALSKFIVFRNKKPAREKGKIL